MRRHTHHPQTTYALIILTLLLASAPAAAAEDANPHLWEPKTTSVSVFKNGLGFFMREGQVTLRDGWCVAKYIPPATFGTLAIYSFDDTETVDLIGSGPGEVVDFDGIDAPDDMNTKRARLAAATSLRIKLTYDHKGATREAAGKLISTSQDYAVVDDGANTLAVPIESINRMAMLELPLRIHIASDKRARPKQSKLGMAYLRKGITWIPEYTLTVIDDDTAELTLRGTLINEAEDLIHCDVNFIVGVPHFVHTDYLTPTAVGQVIRTVGTAVAPPQIRTQIANRAAVAHTQQGTMGPAYHQPAGARGGIGNLPQLAEPGGSDFTIYTKKDMTIRRGEKAIVTLFRKRIKFSHLYRWSPPGRIQHFFVLHNNTDTSWTTGPCLAISGNNPLSEDLLKYTAKGGRTELQVTEAVNVASDLLEKEIDRQFKAYEPSRNVFLDLVTLEGTLAVENYEPYDIELIIRTTIPGKPTFASDDGDVWINPNKLKLTDRDGTVEWRLKLKAGQSKKTTYEYERYVPSR